MASDDQIKFELDLDASKFKEGIEGARMALEAMAKSSKALDEAMSQLKGLGEIAAVLYGAFKILQAVVGSVFEAENIKAVNQQFEILAKNAGVAGDALKEGLVKAAGGLVDDTDLIQAANKALVSMGDSANKLPDIMGLARKATAAFGGDLKNNFEAITQAVSTGNMKMLKGMNIVVDSEEAMRRYAMSIGRTASQLTETERRHALLNAVLDKGKTAFEGVSDSVREAHNTWAQTVVMLKQVGETLTLVFEKTWGETVRKYLSGIREIASDTKKFIEYLYGTESKEDQIQRVSKEIVQLKAHLIDLEAGKRGWWDSVFGPSIQEQISKTRSQIEIAQMELNGLKNAASSPVEVKATAGRGGIETPEQRAARLRDAQLDTKFAADYLKLQEQQLEFSEKIATSKAEWDNLEMSRRVTMEAQRDAELRAAQARYDSGLIDANNFQLAKEQIELQFMQRREEMRRTEEQRQLEIYDNQLRNAQNVGAGIGAAFRQGGAQAAAGMKNFGQQGQMMFKSFEKNSVSALQAFGAGTATASEAAKGFLFGMLADVAEAYGRMMMLTAFETFPAINVPKLAAGAALVALSGFLRSQASGKSAGVGAPSGGVGGGAMGGVAGAAPEANVAQQETQKKSVTIAIQGNYFDTDQTRTRLLELVREASDATDYKYVQIGAR